MSFLTIKPNPERIELTVWLENLEPIRVFTIFKSRETVFVSGLIKLNSIESPAILALACLASKLTPSIKVGITKQLSGCFSKIWAARVRSWV